MRNATTKSVILAPFNSTKTHISQQMSLEAEQFWRGEILKLGIWVRDIDRQYEQNNNCDLDNGVFNEFINKTDSADKGELVQKEATDEEHKKGDFMMLMNETEEDEDEIQDEDYVDVKVHILEKMEERGYDAFYLWKCLEKNEHTYGTTGYALLDDSNTQTVH